MDMSRFPEKSQLLHKARIQRSVRLLLTFILCSRMFLMYGTRKVYVNSLYCLFFLTQITVWSTLDRLGKTICYGCAFCSFQMCRLAYGIDQSKITCKRRTVVHCQFQRVYMNLCFFNNNSLRKLFSISMSNLPKTTLRQ